MVFPHIFRTEHSETHTTNAEYGAHHALKLRDKVPCGNALVSIMKYIDSHTKNIINDLKEAVAIKSVSNDIAYKDEVIKMIKLAEKWLRKLDIKYDCFYIGYHVLDGQKVRLPPVILASCGNDPKKRTLCVYAHMDVVKPNLKDWKTCPWTLTQVEKKFFGAGVGSGKGPLLAWFHVIQAFQEYNIELPINIKFIIESMNNHDSVGLSEFLQTRKLDFFSKIDFIALCDSEWIGEKYPCIIYGTVGILHFDIFAEQNENSNVHEDLSKIVDNIYSAKKEKILIPHFNDWVKQITPDEEQVFESIKDFNVEEIRNSLPPNQQKWDKVKLLMNYWRLPSMLIGDEVNCNCKKGPVNAVKRHVTIKLVQNQSVETAIEQFTNYVKELTEKYNLKSKIKVKLISTDRHWMEKILSSNYVAATRATMQVYKEKPSFIREDRSRKCIAILDDILEKNILFLPLVTKNSNVGEANENISTRNLIEGTKLLAAYIIQLSEVKLDS